MAFLTGRFQPAKAAPDDGFAATVVPVDSAEHFTTLTANNNLSEAVVAAVTVLLPLALVLTTRLRTSSSCTRKKIWNNGFMVSFNIILRNDTVVLTLVLFRKSVVYVF